MPQTLFSLTIVKDAQPNDPQSFQFSIGGGTPFPLDDDGNANNVPSSLFTFLSATAPVTILEAPTPGWNAPVVTCVSGTLNGATPGSTFTPVAGGVTITPVAGAFVTCTFVNVRTPPPGKLTIVKDAQPNDSTNFTFTTNQATIAPFPLDDDADPTLSNTRVVSGSGVITVTETQVPGWTLTGITCNGGGTGNTATATATVTLVPGADITCTFTNTRQNGSITIVKDAQPNDSTNFTFTPTVATIPAFPLDDDSDATLPNSRTFSNLPPGSYGFVETQVPGWTLSSINCTTGGTGTVATFTATIQLAPGANVTCTFVNTQQPGTITIVKDAQPNDSTNFMFSTSIAALAPFPLDDDSDPTILNQRVLTLQPGTYTVTEGATPGWNLTGISCTAGGSGNTATATATIVLTAGANVTCTFTNVKPQTGTLTIVKDAVPNDSADFRFLNFGPNSSCCIPVTLDDDAGAPGADGTFPNAHTWTLPAGDYSVVEEFKTGWNVTGLVCTGGTATVDLPNRNFTATLTAGGAITCTFSNARTAPATGTLTIVKDAVPNDSADFRFLNFGPNSSCCIPVTLDDDAGAPGADGTFPNAHTWTLPAGDYSVVEEFKTGWNVTGLVCTGGTATVDLPNRNFTATLTAGGAITCTFSNARTATLTVVKDAQPNGPQDFRFVTTGGVLAPFDLDDDSDATLPSSRTFTVSAGVAYTVTEDLVAGWTTPSIQCIPAVPSTDVIMTDQANRRFTVNLTPGANVTCTVTNVQQAGSITIVKDAQPNAAQDFSFTHNMAGSPGFTLDDDSDATLSNQRVFPGLAPGSYTFSENATAGWNMTGVSCTPSAGTSVSPSGLLTVNLTAGANVVCTFTNVQAPPDLGITKTAAVSGQTVTYTINISNSGAAPTGTVHLLDLLSGFPPGTIYDSASGVGTCSTPSPGTAWDCEIPNISVPITIVVRLPATGGQITNCGTVQLAGEVNTSNNQACVTSVVAGAGTSSLTIVKDAQPDDAQDFQFSTTGAGIFDFILDDDADATRSNTITFTGLMPGNYTVTELAVAGWTSSGTGNGNGINCTSTGTASSFSSTPNSINLSLLAGSHVTCTFINRP